MKTKKKKKISSTYITSDPGNRILAVIPHGFWRHINLILSWGITSRIMGHFWGFYGRFPLCEVQRWTTIIDCLYCTLVHCSSFWAFELYPYDKIIFTQIIIKNVNLPHWIYWKTFERHRNRKIKILSPFLPTLICISEIKVLKLSLTTFMLLLLQQP